MQSKRNIKKGKKASYFDWKTILFFQIWRQINLIQRGSSKVIKFYWELKQKMAVTIDSLDFMS